MAKYNVTHACGHTSTTSLYGPSGGRQRQMTWMEARDCDECRRSKETEEAKGTAERFSLPELSGTPKQVDWASRIRASFIGHVLIVAGLDPDPKNVGAFYREMFWDKLLNGKQHDALCKSRRKALRDWEKEQGVEIPYLDMPKEHKESLCQAMLSLAISWACEAERASWWIDCRDDLSLLFGTENQQEWHAIVQAALTGGDAEVIAAEVIAKAKAEQEAKAELDREEATIKAEAMAESAIRVEGAKSNLLAVISASGKTVRLQYPEKKESLRELVRAMGFEWSAPHWQRDSHDDDAAREMVAELGHKVLALKIGVSIADEELRAKALAGTFKPAPLGVIKAGMKGAEVASFHIKWERSGDFYDRAKSIHGAKWSKELSVMIVPLESFEEVEDFANRHNFRLTGLAGKTIEVQRHAMSASLRIPAPVIVAPVVGKPGVPVPMADPVVVVPDSLRDDD